MNYFEVNAQDQLVAIHTGREPISFENKLLTRHDFKSFGEAEDMAALASRLSGELYIATDAGQWVSPRFDVQKAPKVGDDVSYAFNGDSYPCGQIVSISPSLKIISTSSGRMFYRRKRTGSWINNGTWSLVPGHVSKLNPEF